MLQLYSRKKAQTESTQRQRFRGDFPHIVNFFKERFFLSAVIVTTAVQ